MPTVRTIVRRASWLFGAAVIAAIAAFSAGGKLWTAISLVEVSQLSIWILSTIAMRVVLIGSLTLPLRLLGHSISKLHAFSLGWARSFCNQVIPLSGLAYYSLFLRRRGVSLGEIAALSSPQFVLAAFTVGMLGCIAAIWCQIGPYEPPLTLTAVFVAVMAGAICFWVYSGTVVARLPGKLRDSLLSASRALGRFKNFGLVRSLIGIHVGAILLRAVRLFVLFAAIVPGTDFSLVLLLSCIGEVVLLLQLTPGGIGVREGAIVAGAMLLNIDAGTAAAVAVIDRALMVSIVCIAAPLAFWQLSTESRG